MLNLFKPRSLGARIIAINFIGLILLALGFIYVDKSEDNLVKARIEALLVQANLFAFSFDLDPEIRENFRENLNKFILKRQEDNKFITTRTRIFDRDLQIIFDTSDFDDRESSSANIRKPYIDEFFEGLENYFGRNAQIEGDFENNSHILLVEDLTTDGNSKIKFCEALREAGAKVDHTFVVFYYDIFPQTRKTLDNIGLQMHSLATWWDVLKVAKEFNYFENDEIGEVESFLNDPMTWSADHGGASSLSG